MASRPIDPESRATGDPPPTPPSGAPRVDDFASAVLARLTERKVSIRRYEIGEEIGKGGMGRVFRARDADLQRDVAMKVIREGAPEARSRGGVSPRSLKLARFLEEAQVAGQLDHPGIVPVHELGVDDAGHVYFTMKLVRGDDLSAVLELASRGADGWSETRVVGVLLKVCEAMAYAHHKQVIHRDLKPSNIRVGRFGAVYVMDWGLARVLGREDVRDLRVRELDEPVSQPVESMREGADGLHTMDGTPIGTPMFMSPEQAMGRVDRMGPQTDVYGVGAILYRLLTGQSPYVSPFTQVDALQIVRWIKEGPPAPVLEIAPRATPELAAICERAMARDPSQRYAGMEELADELRAFLENRVVRAYRTGPFVELRMWVRRNRAVALASLVAILAAFAAVAGQAWNAARRAELQALRLDELGAAELLARVERLGPTAPSSIPEHRRWLDETEALLQRREMHLARLAAVRATALAQGRAAEVEAPADPGAEHDLRQARGWIREFEEVVTKAEAQLRGEPLDGDRVPDPERALELLPAEIEHWLGRVAELERETAPRKTLRFDDRDAQRDFDALEALAANLARLHEKSVPLVRSRLADASTLEDRTLSSPAARERWDAAIASIADRIRSPAYRELVLAPQLGLLPLRQNPDTGLWEFWHVQSGAEPRLDDAGHWIIDSDTGIVLVLLAGGDVTTGAQPSDANAPHYDPNARPLEKPWTATLDPYFISKYEMTQGQWLRVALARPSYYLWGKQMVLTARASGANPVEQVSHEDATRELGRVGLLLPSSAQWEHAARGGSTMRFVAGDSIDVLPAIANYGDDSFDKRSNRESVRAEASDGSAFPRAVGMGLPNHYGVFDALGNVSEWCRDDASDDKDVYTVLPGSGERVPTRPQGRVHRGGDFAYPPDRQRVSGIFAFDSTTRDSRTGVRPVRGVEPAR